MFSYWRNPPTHRPNPPDPSLTPVPEPRHRRAVARIARPAISRCCAGWRLPGRKARDDRHAANAHVADTIPPFRRSVAGSAALAWQHHRIIRNRPTAAMSPANRIASASDHRAHPALQPPDWLILLPHPPPAAVEISIGSRPYPAKCTHSDAFVQPSLRARTGHANSDSFGHFVVADCR